MVVALKRQQGGGIHFDGGGGGGAVAAGRKGIGFKFGRNDRMTGSNGCGKDFK